MIGEAKDETIEAVSRESGKRGLWVPRAMSLLQLQALGGRRSRAGGQTGEPDSQDASGFDGDGPRLSTQVFHHAPAATSFHDLIKELKSSRRSAWLVNPNSTGMKAWDIVVLLLLLFTATVTPYEVAFLSAALGDPSSTKISQFDGLFFVNRIVDVLFLVVRRPGCPTAARLTARAFSAITPLIPAFIRRARVLRIRRTLCFNFSLHTGPLMGHR